MHLPSLTQLNPGSQSHAVVQPFAVSVGGVESFVSDEEAVSSVVESLLVAESTVESTAESVVAESETSTLESFGGVGGAVVSSLPQPMKSKGIARKRGLRMPQR